MALDYEFQDENGNPIPRTSEEAGAGIEVDRGNGIANPNLEEMLNLEDLEEIFEMLEGGNGTANSVPANTNVLRGRTRPLPQGTGTPEPFILSVSEANEYFDNNVDGQGRRAQIPDGGGEPLLIGGYVLPLSVGHPDHGL